MKKNLNISNEELMKIDYKHTQILKNLLMIMVKLFHKELQICLDLSTQKLLKLLNRQDFYLLYNVMTKVVVLEKFKKIGRLALLFQ